MKEKEAKKRTKRFIELLVDLYIRWIDECEYENIDDYLKPIKEVEPRAFEMTSEPFGVKINVDGKIKHIVVAIQGDNLIIGEK